MSEDMSRREDDITVSEIMRSMSSDIGDIRTTTHSTLDRMNQFQKEVENKLATIDERVTILWDAVWGSTRSNHEIKGLVSEIQEMQPIVRAVEKFIEVSKWAIITFTGAILIGLANLAIITFQ